MFTTNILVSPWLRNVITQHCSSHLILTSLPLLSSPALPGVSCNKGEEAELCLFVCFTITTFNYRVQVTRPLIGESEGYHFLSTVQYSTEKYSKVKYSTIK